MTRTKDGISSLQAQELVSLAVARAIEKIRTMSIWKVVAVNPNQTVNIECCYLDVVQNALGEITMVSPLGVRQYATFDPGILVDIPYRVRRNGQFRDMVCPAVGDVGTYTPTYEDMRRWYESGTKVALPSTLRMQVFHGTGVWDGYIQNDKDTQADYPVDNQTRIIKSNRITVTIQDPLNAEGQPTGNESVTVNMTGITLTVSADGTITLNAPNAACNVNCKTANLNASGSAKIDSPATTITGTLQVDGAVTTGATITSGGNITSGGDVISSSGKTLDTHTHQIAQTMSITGASTSGPTAIVATTTPPMA